MKKFLSILLSLALLGGAAIAEDAAMHVFVSISDDAGDLVLAHAPVAVTDMDGDGALTVCDALLCAHITYHPEGAAAFLAEDTEWGKSLYVLWGIDNGGSYGYCVNDASALSLVDGIAEGDHIKAYAFVDLTGWSDTYCFFAAAAEQRAVNAEIVLTLTANGYDESWNPVALPVSGAVITVNGNATDAVTDEQGRAALTLGEAGVYTISAVSQTQTLVPPVCIVTVVE